MGRNRRQYDRVQRDWLEPEQCASGLWRVVQKGCIPGVAIVTLPAPGVNVPDYFETRAQAVAFIKGRSTV